MRKTSVKWEPDYWKEQNLPAHGCFGYLNGQLILGNTHHQMIMALVLHSGWTFEQLMAAEQAWGWFDLQGVYSNQFDMEKLPKHLQNSYYVNVRFSSDAGFQQDEAMQKVLGAFSQMYHLPARRESYVKGKHSEEDYGAGLSGKQNLEYYLENPDQYFSPGQFRKYFPGGMPGQPPDAEWDPDWEKKFLETGHDPHEIDIPGVTSPSKPGIKGKKPQDFPIGSNVRVLNNRWDANVNIGDIGTVKGYGPEDDDDGVAVVFDKDNEVPWYFHPNDLELIPQAPAPSAHLKQIAQEHFDKHGDHPLNGVYWTGSNFNIWGNGYSAWYNQEGIPIQSESPVAPDTVEKWINQKQMEKVDHTPYQYPTTSDVVPKAIQELAQKPKAVYKKADGTYYVEFPDGSGFDHTGNQGGGAIGTVYHPDTYPHPYNLTNLQRIASLWKEAYTPGGKTKGWGDIMEKANYIRQNNGVQILRNDPQHVVGQVQSGTDPQNRGPYQTEIWRDDPQSQAITMWDCDCDWDQYAWGRTRQWKKYEGRPCCHVLALFWDALTHPPQGGGGGGAATPPTPTPGGGVTVNQGLIAPVGQPPMNVPLIGPEGEPAPIGPEPAPAQPPWSEIVQPGKEEGTIQFPGTFSHWKEAGPPTEPPNYRKQDKKNEACGLCKMMYEGKCWGYGNKPVKEDMVCDSFTPDESEKKEAAGNWWGSGRLPENGTFGFINGHLILGMVHHKAILSELLKAGWSWEQLMSAEQAWGWFYSYPKSATPRVELRFVSDSGYQNDEAMKDAVKAFEEMYHLPVETSSYVGGVEGEDEYGTGLGANKALPGAYHYVSEVPPPPTASWKEAAGYPWEEFENWNPGHAEEHAQERYITLRNGQMKKGDMWTPHFELMMGVNPDDIIDAGYIMPNGERYSFMDHTDAHAPYLRRNAAFNNGDIVRVWENCQGYAQPAYGQPGYPVTITKNKSGEVLSSDDETTIVIFPLKTGPMEHHLVKVECPTSNLYLDNTNAQPFVKKH